MDNLFTSMNDRNIDINNLDNYNMKLIKKEENKR